MECGILNRQTGVGLNSFEAYYISMPGTHAFRILGITYLVLGKAVTGAVAHRNEVENDFDYEAVTTEKIRQVLCGNHKLLLLNPTRHQRPY